MKKILVGSIAFSGSPEQVQTLANNFLKKFKNHPTVAIIFRGDSQSIFEQTTDWCESLDDDTPREILTAHQQSKHIMFGIINMPPESCEKIKITADGDVIHLSIKIYKFV